MEYICSGIKEELLIKLFKNTLTRKEEKEIISKFLVDNKTSLYSCLYSRKDAEGLVVNKKYNINALVVFILSIFIVITIFLAYLYLNAALNAGLEVFEKAVIVGIAFIVHLLILIYLIFILRGQRILKTNVLEVIKQLCR